MSRRYTAAEAQALLVGSAEMVASNVLRAAPDLVSSLAATEGERDAAVARAEAAEREVARLRRLMETAPPWEVSDPPTDEEMHALRLRWAFGPERYQADADALIAAALHHREERQTLTAERDALRAIIAGRTAPPTDAEIDAHEAAGGTWTCATAGEWIFSDAGMDAEAARELRSVLAANAWAKPRWWALDADGRPCAWPSVDEVTP